MNTNIYRFVPELKDQVWSTKNCGSQDSGVIVTGSTETMSQDSPLMTNYNFLSVGGEQRESDDSEETELQSQFVKCRQGIRLFRDVSDQSRSPENIKELVHPAKEPEDDYSDGDHEENLCDIVNTMAITRMEDQRCILGGHHNPALLHSQSRDDEQWVRSWCPLHSFLFSPFTNNN